MSVYHLQAPSPSGALRPMIVSQSDQVQTFAVFDGSAAAGDTPAAVLGNLSEDGGGELIVGAVAPLGQSSRDRLEVYHIDPNRPPQRLATLPAFDNTGTSSSSNLAVGDVDASEPGDEVVVGEDGSHRRATRMRVFSGIASGNPRLLLQFRALPVQAAALEPLAFALGDVFPDADHPGKEIVVGDAKGRLYVYAIRNGTAVTLQRFTPFPDPPRTSAHRLAVGDVLPDVPGEEIVVADDGSRKDGTVRVLDARNGMPLLEFVAFEPGQAPAGVEVWVADVIASLPGAEVIVGQGSAGGRLRVFSLAHGIPQHVLDLPDPLHRTTSLRQHLTVGDLVPGVLGSEVAVAQSDPRLPVQIFQLDEGGAQLITEIDLASDLARSAPQGLIGTIAIGR